MNGYAILGVLLIAVVVYGIGSWYRPYDIGDGKKGRSPDWAFMARLDIPPRGPVYLKRMRLINTPWFGIYLHKMTGPDPSPVMHDHPWSFRSIILRGCYAEVTEYGRTGLFGRRYDLVHVRRRFNSKRAEDTHFIKELGRIPTWTLLLVGPRRREWGFVTPEGRWVLWSDYEKGVR